MPMGLAYCLIIDLGVDPLCSHRECVLLIAHYGCCSHVF